MRRAARPDPIIAKDYIISIGGGQADTVAPAVSATPMWTVSMPCSSSVERESHGRMP